MVDIVQLPEIGTQAFENIFGSDINKQISRFTSTIKVLKKGGGRVGNTHQRQSIIIQRTRILNQLRASIGLPPAIFKEPFVPPVQQFQLDDIDKVDFVGTAPVITDPRQTSDPAIKATFDQVTTSTSAFEVGSTIGAVSFSPTTATVENPQNRSTIRIDTSQSGLANNLATITLNVIVRDSAFLGDTISVNVIDANTGLQFRGSTTSFILRSRNQRVDNIVWLENRERISGQVILSRLNQDFSKGVNFEFQSTTIPDRPPEPMPDFPPIPEEPPIEEDTGRNLFQSAIIGVLALGALGGSLLDNKRRKK